MLRMPKVPLTSIDERISERIRNLSISRAARRILLSATTIASGVVPPELLDSCDESSDTAYVVEAVHPSVSGVSAIGQAFKLAAAAQVTSVQFKLLNAVGATGNLYAALYNSTGTYGTDAKPTGSALVQSGLVSMASLPTVSADWVEFTFSTPYTVSALTVYCVDVEVESISLFGEIEVTHANSSVAHAGNLFDYDNGWVIDWITDTQFKLYGYWV